MDVAVAARGLLLISQVDSLIQSQLRTFCLSRRIPSNASLGWPEASASVIYPDGFLRMYAMVDVTSAIPAVDKNEGLLFSAVHLWF